MNELPIWQARSFWLQIGALLAALFSIANQPELAEEAKNDFPDKVTTAIAAVLALWAYIERIFGKMKLVV